MEYSEASIKRAEQAICSSPFTLNLLADMTDQGIDLKAIAGEEGVKNHYLQTLVNTVGVENSLLWLIQVGVLRREVDGQGITDSFRLTPLGFYILGKWQTQGYQPVATWRDRFQNLWTQSTELLGGMSAILKS
jgi:hypothetical protein